MVGELIGLEREMALAMGAGRDPVERRVAHDAQEPGAEPLTIGERRQMGEGLGERSLHDVERILAVTDDLQGQVESEAIVSRHELARSRMVSSQSTRDQILV